MIKQFFVVIKVQKVYHFVTLYLQLTQWAVLRFIISIFSMFVIGKAFRNETWIQY